MFSPTYWTENFVIADTWTPYVQPKIYEQPIFVPLDESIEQLQDPAWPAPPQAIAHPIPPSIVPPEIQPLTQRPAEHLVVRSQVDTSFGFAEYPYANGFPGWLSQGSGKEFSASAFFEAGTDFDRLDRKGLGFLIEHESRFGVDFKWDSYVEDAGDGWTDELHITDFNLLYRLVESDHYAIRAGVGVNVLGDAYGTEAGFNLTAKADLFPIKPIVLSGEMDLGTIGDAEMFHLRGKVGLQLDRFEIFGGYDYRTLGSVPLEGALLGVEVWF